MKEIRRASHFHPPKLFPISPDDHTGSPGSIRFTQTPALLRYLRFLIYHLTSSMVQSCIVHRLLLGQAMLLRHKMIDELVPASKAVSTISARAAGGGAEEAYGSS